MKKTTLEEVQHHPGKKFSIGERPPKRFDSPQYMVCYLNEHFESPSNNVRSGGSLVTVVGLRTGKLELMPVDMEIWLFNLV